MEKCKDCDNIMILCDCKDNPKWDKIRAGISERYPELSRKFKYIYMGEIEDQEI